MKKQKEYRLKNLSQSDFDRYLYLLYKHEVYDTLYCDSEVDKDENLVILSVGLRELNAPGGAVEREFTSDGLEEFANIFKSGCWQEKSEDFNEQVAMLYKWMKNEV